MRRSLLVLAVLALLTACEDTRTVNGKTEQCVGLNGGEKPGVRYEYSARNIIVGIIFAEIVIPPVVVVLSELKCPVTP